MTQGPRAPAEGQPTRRARLSAEDWAEAALGAIRTGGLAAVAVEPLAKRLGTTKGSFYWHFANRDALIEAALMRWERQQTDAVIADAEQERSAEGRIRALRRITAYTADIDPVELVLLADAEHPEVAAALHRVTTRRLDYLTSVFAEYGLPADTARHRALLAYVMYLGHAQLAHVVPDALPSGQAADRYLDAMLEIMLRR